jgi:hypothetical protein
MPRLKFANQPTCLTYSVYETADACGVCVSNLYAMWKRGEGPPYFYVGGRRKTMPDEVAAYLRTLERQSPPSHVSDPTGAVGDDHSPRGYPRMREREQLGRLHKRLESASPIRGAEPSKRERERMDPR